MWGTRFVRRVWLALGRVLHAQVDFGAQSGCIHFFGCCGGRRSSTLICQPCLRSAGDLLRLRLKFRDRAKPYIFLDALRPGVDVGTWFGGLRTDASFMRKFNSGLQSALERLRPCS